MNVLLQALLFFALSPLANAAGIAEPRTSKVVILTRDTFRPFMNKYPLVLMEWYTAWCEHCQEMAPKLQIAAEKLHEMKQRKEIPIAAKIAKMDDGDPHNKEGRFGAVENYNFTSYPTLITFKNGEVHKEYEPWDGRYYGGREIDDIVFWMASLARGKNPIEEERRLRPGLYRPKTTSVYELSPETFNATVKRPASLGNNVIWVVKFYSDRCPFCRSMSPEVVTAAETLAKEAPNVFFAAVNSRVYHETAEENGVTGYPWVAAFYNGKKIEDMAGLGGASTMVNFGKRMAAQHYDESLGAAPVRKPATYDETGMFIMEPEVAAWAEQEAAKWDEPSPKDEL